MIIPKARRLNEVNEYYLSRKLEEIRQMNASGADVINLGIGSPDLAPSEQTIETLKISASHAGKHGYQSYRGAPVLREAIAEWSKEVFGISVNGQTEVLPLMGSKEGIMHVSMAFLNEGDEVLVPDPGYPTYTSVSKLLGATVRSYEVSATGQSSIDVEKLADSDLSKVKLMWLNFPHMPTGRKADKKIFAQLVALAKEKQFLLCHDNPYSLILNEDPMSILEMDGAREVAIELNSLSKSHNMAGWRVGWIAGRQDYLDNILTVKSNFDSGMFLPIQEAAAQALNNDVAWHEKQSVKYQERKELATKLLDLLRCTYFNDQAGMFVWAKLPDEVANGEELVDKLLKKAQVFITPGAIFGKNGERYLRVSLCTPRSRFEEAINRVNKYLASEA